MRAIARDLLGIRPYHRRLSLLEPLAEWQKIAYGTHARQYGLWAAQPTSHAPLAVWIHGGGWRFGNPELLEAFGNYFYARGYHVWMPSHRRLPRFRGGTILKDVLESLEVPQRQLGRELPMLIGGMSSGGQLAALCALHPQLAQRYGFTVAGLLACGAPLSLAHLSASPIRRRLAGAPASARWQSVDPLAQLTQVPDFPAVVLHGTHDGLVPLNCALAFVGAARRLGWRQLKFIALPGGDHLSAAEWVFLDEDPSA